MQHLLYSPDPLIPLGDLFPKSKIHLNTNRNTMTSPLHIKRVNIRGASANGKLAGVSVLNAKEICLKKINVSFFVH